MGRSERSMTDDQSIQTCKCGKKHTRITPKGDWRPSCKAHRRDGDPCGFWPIAGLAVCKMHGGAMKHSKKRAARNVAEKKAREALSVLGEPIAVNPTEALLALIYSSAGHVQWLRTKINEVGISNPDNLIWGQTKYMDKTGGEDWGTTTVEEATVNAWLKLYNEERDRLANYCTRALKAGIEERKVRLAESQGALVAGVIQKILGDLKLSEKQKALVGTIVPNRLRELSEDVS